MSRCNCTCTLSRTEPIVTRRTHIIAAQLLLTLPLPLLAARTAAAPCSRAVCRISALVNTAASSGVSSRLFVRANLIGQRHLGTRAATVSCCSRDSSVSATMVGHTARTEPASAAHAVQISSVVRQIQTHTEIDAVNVNTARCLRAAQRMNKTNNSNKVNRTACGDKHANLEVAHRKHRIQSLPGPVALINSADQPLLVSCPASSSALMRNDKQQHAQDSSNNYDYGQEQ